MVPRAVAGPGAPHPPRHGALLAGRDLAAGTSSDDLKYCPGRALAGGQQGVRQQEANLGQLMGD